MDVWLYGRLKSQTDEMLTFNGILPDLFDQVVCDRLQFIRGSLLLGLRGVGADGIHVCGVGDDEVGAGVVVLLRDRLLQLDVGGGGVEHQAGEEIFLGENPKRFHRYCIQMKRWVLSEFVFFVTLLLLILLILILLILIIIMMMLDLARKTPMEEMNV